MALSRLSIRRRCAVTSGTHRTAPLVAHLTLHHFSRQHFATRILIGLLATCISAALPVPFFLLVPPQGEGAKFALRVPLEEAPAPADAASNDAVSEVTDAFADWAEGDPNEPLLPVFVAFRAPQARVRPGFPVTPQEETIF